MRERHDKELFTTVADLQFGTLKLELLWWPLHTSSNRAISN